MHTSAHPTGPIMEYTGTLLRQAEARTKPLDHEGHSIPVLCMEIEPDNALHTRMHIEQPFPADAAKQAHAAARRLKKDMRVTVQAPLIGVLLVATNASHVHVITDQQEEIPCPQ